MKKKIHKRRSEGEKSDLRLILTAKKSGGVKKGGRSFWVWVLFMRGGCCGGVGDEWVSGWVNIMCVWFDVC